MSRIKLTMPLPPKLTEWLKDVYPAWAQLPQEAFYGLVPFNAPESPLHLDYLDIAADISASAMFSNLRLFLTLIGEGRIVLLPDGTMASDSLDLLLATTDWPNYDIELTRMHRRPLDQENLGPLDFLIALAIACQFVEVAEGRIKVTDAGRRLHENRIDAATVRSVFEATFLKINPRTLTKLAQPWVHEQAGIVFWGLSKTADVPRTVPELTRYCFVPPEKFLNNTASILEVYMRSVYLLPLTWLGLMSTTAPQSTASIVHDLLFQKTPLFDRFMQFTIEPAVPVERPN
jgi:hypothetical protein